MYRISGIFTVLVTVATNIDALLLRLPQSNSAVVNSTDAETLSNNCGYGVNDIVDVQRDSGCQRGIVGQTCVVSSPKVPYVDPWFSHQQVRLSPGDSFTFGSSSDPRCPLSILQVDSSFKTKQVVAARAQVRLYLTTADGRQGILVTGCQGDTGYFVALANNPLSLAAPSGRASFMIKAAGNSISLQSLLTAGASVCVNSNIASSTPATPTAAPGTCPIPSGSFVHSCSGSSVSPACVLSSQCKTISGSVQRTTMDMQAVCGCYVGSSCNMDNINGVLRCGNNPTTTTTTTTTAPPTAAPIVAGASTVDSCYSKMSGRFADQKYNLNVVAGSFTPSQCASLCDADPMCGAFVVDAFPSPSGSCATLLPDALTIENNAYDVYGKVPGMCGYQGPATDKTLDQFTLHRLENSDASSETPAVEVEFLRKSSTKSRQALVRRIHSN